MSYILLHSKKSNGILLRHIALWIERGQVIDPYGDFFVEERNDVIQLFHEKNKRYEYLPSLQDFHANKELGFLQKRDEAICIVQNRIPNSVVSLSLANRIFFIGKTVRVLLQVQSKSSDHPSTNRAQEKADTIGISHDISNIFQKATNVHYNERLPLSQILECSIAEIHNHVSQLLYEVLMGPSLHKSFSNSTNLIGHLENVRLAYLLGDGQLFTALCEECDSSQLWTKSSPNCSDFNPMEFQMTALYPVMRHLYGWDSNDFVSLSGWRLELTKRISIISIPRSFIFSDFNKSIYPILELGGLGAHHDRRNGCIVLSSSSVSKVSNRRCESLPKEVLGFVYTRTKQNICNGSSLSASFQFVNDKESSNGVEKKKSYGNLILVIDDDIPTQNSFCLETSTGQDTKCPAKRNTAHPIFLIRITQTENDSFEGVAIFVNGEKCVNHLRIEYTGVIMTLTVTLDSNRLDIYLSSNDINVNDFPPKTSSSFLVASLEHSILLKNINGAHIGIGATPTVTKLHQWSFTPGKQDKSNNLSLNLADELSDLSDNDLMSLPPLHHTRLAFKKVQHAVSSKLAWLDVSQTSSYHILEPLQLQYSLPWPFHLILREESFKMYNRIFNRMFAVQRASYEIHQTWRVLLEEKYRSLPNSNRLWLAPLWATRTKMDFFVSNLLQYWKLDVAGSAFHKLKLQSIKVKSFEALTASHTQYLGLLRRHCFFDSERLSNSLKKILTMVLRFTETVRSVKSLGEIPSTEVNRLSKLFDLETSNFFIILRESDATELHTRLDFNGWYSLLSI